MSDIKICAWCSDKLLTDGHTVGILKLCDSCVEAEKVSSKSTERANKPLRSKLAHNRGK